MCQMNNQGNKNYSHLPPRTVDLFPWETTAVDLVIVPLKIKVNGIELECWRALTSINPVSNSNEVKAT